MRLSTAQKWRRTLAWLRREFPSRYAVAVRSRLLPKKHKLYGDTDFRQGKFVIRINSNENFSARIDTILHEWAHVLTRFGAEHKEHHSDEWGLCYAKIYRAFIEWDYGRRKKHEP